VADVSSRLDRFPEGTSVSAYPVSRWTALGIFTPSGAPLGAAVDTKTVTSGTLTWTTLTAGTEYFLYAQVGGEHRYIKFTAGANVNVTPAVVASRLDTLLGLRDKIGQVACSIPTTAVAAATYILRDAVSAPTAPDVTTTGAASDSQTFRLDPADFPAPAGKQARLRLRYSVLTPATPPAKTYTFALEPVTISASVLTPGGAVAGSSKAIASPAGNSDTYDDTANIPFPAAGRYVVTCRINTDTPASVVAVFADISANFIDA
jgi:hypothetical protein